MKTIGIIGARGFVGGELLRLLAAHSGFELAMISSRSLDGQRVCDAFEHPSELQIRAVEPSVEVASLDALVLALPNGLSGLWVEAADAGTKTGIGMGGQGSAPAESCSAPANGPVIVDVSADHRFDDAWVYGLPEHNRTNITNARRIANPGCYATGVQVALRPMLDLLDGDAWAFGVSGYSGAGSTPSPKNDPVALADNLMPYKSVGHLHELEVTRHLTHRVNFMPHVAPFFRGITLTITAYLKPRVTAKEVVARYRTAAECEPLITWSHDAPLVRDCAGRHEVNLGGVTFDPERRRLVVVATLDNLLKGAATQVLQNLNLACGFDELEGIA